MKNIQIAISFDENYIYPAIVCLTSLFENAEKNTKYIVTAMVPGDISEEAKLKILSLVKNYPRHEINFYDMKKTFVDAPTSSQFTTPTYYRLKISEVLKNEDKCLYFDVDTVILNDLQELYNTDIENYYIAGVYDYAKDFQEIDERMFKLANVQGDKYINAGVLLLNLKKLRHDNMPEKFEQKALNSLHDLIPYADQDVLNALCYEKILAIKPKFNKVFGWAYRFYSDQDRNESSTNPSIIHYATIKPWINENATLQEKWIKYAKKTKFYKEICEKFPVLKSLQDSENIKHTPQTKEMQIAISLDENYVYPGIVMLTSLFENASLETSYVVTIMVPGDLAEKSKLKLLSLNEKYKKHKIIFYNMGDAFNDSHVTYHYKTPMYFKLKLPEILKKQKKCLYIDVDAIVLKDLKELYETNIDDYYIAGVQDPARNSNNTDVIMKKLANVQKDKYISVGAMLLNLKKMREDRIQEKLENLVLTAPRDTLLCPEQDIINAVCYEKILTLKIKYHFYALMTFPHNAIYYPKEELEEAAKQHFIFHYAGPLKPWNNPSVYNSCPWFKYAKKTKFYDEICEKFNLENTKHE